MLNSQVKASELKQAGIYCMEVSLHHWNNYYIKMLTSISNIYIYIYSLFLKSQKKAEVFLGHDNLTDKLRKWQKAKHAKDYTEIRNRQWNAGDVCLFDSCLLLLACDVCSCFITLLSPKHTSIFFHNFFLLAFAAFFYLLIFS